MRRRLTSVSVHKTSFTVALMYAVLIFIIGIVMAVIGTPVAAAVGAFFFDATVTGVMVWLIFSVAFATVGAIAYGIFGYIFTALAASVYNIVVRWTGGVEFTLSDSE